MCPSSCPLLPNITNTQCIACQTLCQFTSDFSNLPLSSFKLKNRHWWNTGPKYHRISYLVKVALGPADIRFELWHNGQKLSKDNSIKVEWHAAQAPQPSDDNGFYPSSPHCQPQTAGNIVNGQANGLAWPSSPQLGVGPAIANWGGNSGTWNRNIRNGFS